MTQVELASLLGIPFRRVNLIVRGRRGVTPDTALRLSQLFGNSAQFWLNLQQNYDLSTTMLSPVARQIRRIRPLSQKRRRVLTDNHTKLAGSAQGVVFGYTIIRGRASCAIAPAPAAHVGTLSRQVTSLTTTKARISPEGLVTGAGRPSRLKTR